MSVIWTRPQRILQPNSAVQIAPKFAQGVVKFWVPGMPLAAQNASTFRATPDGLALSTLGGAIAPAKLGTGPIVGNLSAFTMLTFITRKGILSDYGSNGQIAYSERSEDTVIQKLGIKSTYAYYVIRNDASVLINGASDSAAQINFDSTRAINVLAYITKSPTSRTIWADGNSKENTTSVSTPTGGMLQATIGGDYFDNTANMSAGTLAVVLWNRALSAAELSEINRNPWALFTPSVSHILPINIPSGANTTGTLAVTLADATLSGIGGVTRSGTLAATLADATLAGVGGVSLSGTLATTLADATLVGIGAVTRSGTLAVTLDDATLAGQGTVAVGANISGSAAITLADATLAGIGAVTRSGTTSTTLADATLAGVGAVTRSGTLSVTLDNATLTGVGTITGETVPVSHGGGMSQASNVSGKKKPKKKAKSVESEEWLKAEATARALLQERFTKTTPQDKIEALTSHIESLQPVIAALKALATKEEVTEESVQEEPSVHETRTDTKPEQPQPIVDRYDVLLSRIDDLEELIIIMMANQ